MTNEAGNGRIVVGVDGSEPSKRALEWAIRQARVTGGSVEAIASWQLPTAYGWVPPADVDWEGDAAKELTEAVRAVAGDQPSVPIRSTVVEGNPAEVLVNASRDAELLVVGNRGHGGFAGLLLGSVSQQCVHHAHCPVVVIHGDAPEHGSA
ncbi:universal stress protein [Actinoallomurus soli]|uniref:universal stress protein n=1 Tax=Actinoallomurus soli TaxID=2952535 RepID=UPI00209353FC|nr:universal stress protein [Actinoallomurus soli]MCO5971655.1 universal stress protein [Actinoallomurus soli]